MEADMKKVSRRNFIEGAAILGMGSILGLSPLTAQAAVPADIIFHGGKILTMDSGDKIVEAIAVANGTIIAAGSSKAILARKTSHTKIIDLAGKTMMPGLIDGHSHFPYAGIVEVTKVDLAPKPLGNVGSLDEAYALLRERAFAMKPGEWLMGCNLFPTLLQDKRNPTWEELESITQKHPMIVWHGTGHLVFVNSLALKAAGITTSTADPSGGKIVRDSKGNPTGTLEGRAQYLVSDIIPAPTEEQMLAGCAQSSRMYLERGVTFAQSMTYDIEEYPLLPLLQKSFDQGLIKNRVSFFPRITEKNYQKVLDSLGTKRTGDPLHTSGLLHLGAIKAFSDGSPGGLTAYYSKPYVIVPEGESKDYRGFPVYQREKLIKIVTEIHKKGFQMAIHCNGDQAIEDVLDAYEAALKTAPREARHIAIHAQFSRKDQVQRMKKLGVIPSFYPDCIYYIGDLNKKQLGDERANFMNPVGYACDHGVTCTLHSDTPIAPIRPFLSVDCAVNRKTMSGVQLGTEADKASRMEALRAITINGAYEYFMEDKLGSIEPGKLADLVILDRDPLTIPSEDLRNVKVLKTYVGGKEVYSA